MGSNAGAITGLSVCMQCLPMDGTSPLNVAIYAVLLFLMGLCIAAAAPACNNPVFAEIVPPELRNMVRFHCTTKDFLLTIC